MNSPIEDQLRDYFTMVDRMQGPVDPTTLIADAARTADAPTLSLVTDQPDTEPTTEIMMLSPDRNEPPARSRTWLLIAACVAALALVGGLLVATDRGSDDEPADEPTETLAPAPALPETGNVALIVPATTDPFTSALVDAVQAVADTRGTGVTVAPGGDSRALADAVDAAVARGDSGILVMQIDDTIRPSLDAARSAGVIVVGLGTSPAQVGAVDATVAYDDYISGQLAGLAAQDAFWSGSATIAMLDLAVPSVESADILRDQGFLNGFGIVAGCSTIGCGREQIDSTGNGNEPTSGSYTGFTTSGEYDIVCHEPTAGTIEGGRTAMEACLAANGDINVVYVVDDAAARGAADAIDAVGRTGEVVVATIGGSCDVVDLIADGRVTASAFRPAAALAELAVQTMTALGEGGTVVPNSSAGDFVTPSPQSAVSDSSNDPGHNVTSSTRAAEVCWG